MSEAGLVVGQLIDGLEVGPVAHGGHFVARHEGRVIFVRGALTGELVSVRVTEVRKRFARAEVTRVERADPHRVVPPCPVAGRCGGCDFQHVDLAWTRELKRQVIVEQLDHLGGYHFDGQVEEILPAPFGWRSRMRYQLDAAGRPGLRGHRSGEIVDLPAEGCRLAHPSIAAPPEGDPGAVVLGVAASSLSCFVDPHDDLGAVSEDVGGRQYQVRTDGFWQAHVAAPEVLVDAVLSGLAPRSGEVAFDLYCGVGLFAGALADAGCRVHGIEGDRDAAALAADNVPSAHVVAGDVSRRMSALPARADLVVLDPPRSGAGTQVLAQILRRRPRAIAYVACDPAALGRDLGFAAGEGYRVASLRAFDLFPLTHHVECVAVLERS